MVISKLNKISMTIILAIIVQPYQTQHKHLICECKECDSAWKIKYYGISFSFLPYSTSSHDKFVGQKNWPNCNLKEYIFGNVHLHFLALSSIRHIMTFMSFWLILRYSKQLVRLFIYSFSVTAYAGSRRGWRQSQLKLSEGGFTVDKSPVHHTADI